MFTAHIDAELLRLRASAREQSRRQTNPRHTAFWADVAEIRLDGDTYDRVNAFTDVVERHFGSEARDAAFTDLVSGTITHHQKN